MWQKINKIKQCCRKGSKTFWIAWVVKSWDGGMSNFYGEKWAVTLSCKLNCGKKDECNKSSGQISRSTQLPFFDEHRTSSSPPSLLFAKGVQCMRALGTPTYMNAFKVRPIAKHSDSPVWECRSKSIDGFRILFVAQPFLSKDTYSILKQKNLDWTHSKCTHSV